MASGTSTTQFARVGASLAAEYDGSGNMLRRYVHGAGADAPVALYEGASTGVTNRDYYQPDERGSVMALVNHDGSNRAVKAYDEYGITNNPALSTALPRNCARAPRHSRERARKGKQVRLTRLVAAP